jgi:SAM-dependent methyltransferase
MNIRASQSVSTPVSALRGLALGTLLACATALPATAQREAPQLDVPFVPTPEEVVDKMLDMANVTEKDFVIDLGSGDGRIVIAAAKRGAQAKGVDLNPVRVEEAIENAKQAGLEGKVEFVEGNVFDFDFSKADVLTMYLLSSVNLKLRPRVLDELRPGTRVVSHAFDMGEWEADEVANVDGRIVYFWLVPAKVEGNWNVNRNGDSFTVTFKQAFQTVTGTANIGGKEVPIEDGKLQGTEITFAIPDGKGGKEQFSGTVNGDKITPAADQKTAGGWEATRGS